MAVVNGPLVEMLHSKVSALMFVQEAFDFDEFDSALTIDESAHLT